MEKRDWSLLGWGIVAIFNLLLFLPWGMPHGWCPVGEPHADYLLAFHGSNEDFERLNVLLTSVFVILSGLFGTIYFLVERGKQKKASQYWQSKWEHSSDKNPDTLLRASGVPTAQVLLRPASDVGTEDSQQLLRANNQCEE